MRNWYSLHIFLWKLNSQKVGHYLWGIDTEEACRFYADNSSLRKVGHYLWGIDTYLLKLAAKIFFFLCSLPMRNWYTFHSPVLAIFGRTLPMRNWYFLMIISILEKRFQMSDITYEELIPSCKFAATNDRTSSDITYEELIPVAIHASLKSHLWSDITYEELILSSNSPSYSAISRTLPMRNWYLLKLAAKIFFCVGHYLWGIDTYLQAQCLQSRLLRL